MTIVEQIKKALSDMGFKAQPEIETIRAELANAQNALTAAQEAARLTIASKDEVIAGLKESAIEAATTITAQRLEITTLTTQLEAEKAKTDEALSSMGVSVKHIPAAGPDADPKASATSLIDKLNSISDPVERAKFRKANAAALFAAVKIQQQSK